VSITPVLSPSAASLPSRQQPLSPHDSLSPPHDSLAVEGGYLILSGFAPADVAVIRTAFAGQTVIDEKVEGDWAALCLRVDA